MYFFYVNTLCVIFILNFNTLRVIIQLKEFYIWLLTIK
nr:MAG TPA: hypothetical protein [Caudoviricetes sp.]